MDDHVAHAPFIDDTLYVHMLNLCTERITVVYVDCDRRN